MKKITIDPVTRLEGHGRIDLFLNDEGDVANAYMVIPELRGFEKFSQGRRVEELTDITPRICGVCPEAHHMASTKACDAVFHVDPPPTAKKLRELFYSAFYVADHMTHFYILGGPDFVMGPDAAGGRAQYPRRDPQGGCGSRHQGHPGTREGHGHHRHVGRPQGPPDLWASRGRRQSPSAKKNANRSKQQPAKRSSSPSSRSSSSGISSSRTRRTSI